MSSAHNDDRIMQYLRNALLAQSSIATDNGDATGGGAKNIDSKADSQTLILSSTKSRAVASDKANAVIRLATVAMSKITDASKDIIWALDHIDSDVAKTFEAKIKDMLYLLGSAEKPLIKFKASPIMWLPLELHIEILHMATVFNEQTPFLDWHSNGMAADRVVWANFIRSQLRGVGELIEAAPHLETQILDAYFDSLHLDLTDAPYSRAGKLLKYDYTAMERRILAVDSVPFLKRNVRHASWTWTGNLRMAHQNMCLDFLLGCPNLKTLKIVISDAELWRRVFVNGRTDRMRGRYTQARNLFAVVNAMTIARLRGLDRLDFVLDFKYPTSSTAAETQQFLATKMVEWANSRWYSEYTEAMSAIARSPKDPGPLRPTRFRNYVGVLRSGKRVQEPLD